MNIRNKCDFCDKPAVYDAKTIYGPWAYLCQAHFEVYALNKPGMFTRLEVPVVQTKVCILCGQEKPLEEFYPYKDLRGVERYRNECKECNGLNRKRRRMKGAKK